MTVFQLLKKLLNLAAKGEGKNVVKGLNFDECEELG